MGYWSASDSKDSWFKGNVEQDDHCWVCIYTVPCHPTWFQMHTSVTLIYSVYLSNTPSRLVFLRVRVRHLLRDTMHDQLVFEFAYRIEALV